MVLSAIPQSMNPSKLPVCVSDFHALAKERLPKVWFDYQDGGADDEQTVQDNVKAFQR